MAFGVLLIGSIISLPGRKAWTHQNAFSRGEVFVALDNGIIQRRSPDGVLIQTLDTGRTGFIAGMAFDAAGNLYATAFTAGTVVKFDRTGNLLGTFGSGYSGQVESILFDGSGNAYVGAVDGDNDIRKFDAAGNPLARFNVMTERRGADWIELAADQCTMFYTSEGRSVKRYDVCADKQLPNFFTGASGANFALRILPSGGMLVASFGRIVRLDAAGTIIQTYDAAGEDGWFALNLDPDGRSFWSAGIASGDVYKFDIAAGTQLLKFGAGRSVNGLAIAGEITVAQPQTDLEVTKAASPNPVTAETKLTYTLAVTNKGTIPAVNVTLTDPLPGGTSFDSLPTPTGWSCMTPAVGATGTVNCAIPSLAPGASATFKLTVTVNCSVADGASLSNTASVAAMTADSDPGNNSGAATATVKNTSAQPILALAGGRSAFDFGAVAASRESNPNPPSDTFTIENPGCAPLLLNFAVNRTGSDATNGRIANLDDSALFPVRLINADGTETPLPISPGSPPVQIPGRQKHNFRVQFNPLIPILAGRTTELFANQVIPDVITSQLTITSGAGAPLMINLTGRVSTPAKMIHPSDSRLEPLVVFTRAGNEFTIECSTHDSNLDLRQARYQFLDQNDRPVGAGADVGLTQPIAQRNLVRGQSFTIIQKFTGASQRPEINKVRVTLLDGETAVTTAPAVLGVTEAALASVSAASFLNTALASESIVSSFGNGLASGAQTAAATPLPTSLAGVTVRVRDGAGVERASPLFFVSPGQINFQIPAETMVGAATVSVVRENRIAARGVVQVANTSPGLFAANANGQGAAAAVALRVSANGSQQFEPVAQFDSAQNRFIPRALDLGSSGDQLYLALFGAGVRFRRSSTPVVVRIGGVESPAIFAGSQGGFVGLDQINVLVPRSLAGRGEVDVTVTVDGRTSNPVRVRFGGSASALPATRAEMVNDQNVGASAVSREAAATILLPALKLTPDPAPQSEGHGAIRRSGGTKEK